MPRYVTELRSTDVLFGRGSGPNDHEGNVRFRLYVAKRKVAYMATNHRLTKAKIAKEIVDLVVTSNGRFLKKVEHRHVLEELGLPDGADCYEIVDDETIMEKAKQALRQNAAKVRGEVQDAALLQSLVDDFSSNTPGDPAHKHTQSLPITISDASDLLHEQVSPSPPTYHHHHHDPRSSASLYEDDLEPLPLHLPSTSSSRGGSGGAGGYRDDTGNRGHVMQPTMRPPMSLPIPEHDIDPLPVDTLSSQQQQQHMSLYGSDLSQGYHVQMQPRPIDSGGQGPMHMNTNQHLLGHRHTVSAPVDVGGHETSNYSMAEIPTDEVGTFRRRESHRASITVSDLMKDYTNRKKLLAGGTPDSNSGSTNSGSSNGNNHMSSGNKYRRAQSPSMDDLMGSFSRMKTGGMGSAELEQRRMMASSDTMGTIEQLGSVADMSLATMGSSTFSLFRGNESMLLHEESGGRPADGILGGNFGMSSPSNSTSNNGAMSSATTMGSSRSSKNSFESTTSFSLDALHDSKMKSSSLMNSSINGIISEVRRQVESEYPSMSTLPKSMGDTQDELALDAMGHSSISALKTAYEEEEDVEEEEGDNYGES
jgi:hypothetical protein